MPGPDELYFSDNDDANRLLAEDPVALLVGIILYQQVPIEKAFIGPLLLRERLGGALEVEAIADMEPDAIETVFREKPALHRFPASMAKRTQGVCRYLVDHHGGEVTGLWEGAATASEVLERMQAMPGFGDYKARVYFGVLATRYGLRPKGWEDAVPDWPSIADIEKPDDLPDLKFRKKRWKESGS